MQHFAFVSAEFHPVDSRPFLQFIKINLNSDSDLPQKYLQPPQLRATHTLYMCVFYCILQSVNENTEPDWPRIDPFGARLRISSWFSCKSLNAAFQPAVRSHSLLVISSSPYFQGLLIRKSRGNVSKALLKPRYSTSTISPFSTRPVSLSKEGIRLARCDLLYYHSIYLTLVGASKLPKGAGQHLVESWRDFQRCLRPPRAIGIL